jgi:charged multivesicular body protein 1
MGNKQVKKSPQELMQEAIFKLSMSAKRFERESIKSEKEKNKNLQKAEICLKKGDEQGARLFVQNAQNNIQDKKKYLAMSSKLGVIASKLKSNNNSQEIMHYLHRDITPALA